MALGACSRNILFQISHDALLMLIPGAAFGLMGAVALTRALTNLLFEVSPLDPIALAITCVALAGIGLLAGFLPVKHAVHVDPAVTLRDMG
jgi:ABC-type antimicrobial peptide transport system permease subunit